MPRSYRHIKDYEKEIPELKENGLTHREIAKKYGLTKEHIKQFFNRLQYELTIKDRYIKRLEMENELMRGFLSLTERK